MRDPFQLESAKVKPFKDKDEADLIQDWADGVDWNVMCVSSGLTYTALYHILRTHEGFGAANEKRLVIEKEERRRRAKKRRQKKLEAAVEFFEEVWAAGGPVKYSVKNHLDETQVRSKLSSLRQRFPELRAAHY